MDEKSDLPKPTYETYATNIPMSNGIDIVRVVISRNFVFLMENRKIKYYGDTLFFDNHVT